MIQHALSRLVLLALTAAATAQPAIAAPGDAGRKLYREHCASCHGKAGDGVKGKYNDALHGDWSFEKLTRYIDKNMPEDNPDALDAAQSAVVAGYINDAFYSREARARNNPARVELVRLTNRQYVNTVADLLRSITSADDKPPAGELGLRANYRSRVAKDEKKKLEGFRKELDRVDRVVAFTFRPDSTNTSALGLTNAGVELNISWRGSVRADETGDYEFILQTPNGARLWVNDDNEPIIDAWVASGTAAEHKATLRLLGGRLYPIRVEYFKAAKDKETTFALRWKPPHGAPDEIPARNLITGRASPTFVLRTPFPADDSSMGYERGIAVSKDWDDATTQAAIEVANFVTKNLDRFSGSKPADTNRVAKLETFAQNFVTAAFRRPLSTEQKRAFVSTQFKKAAKPEDAVKRAVLLALKSPRFLYLGLEERKPDDYDAAARLSFGLWDSLPDRELLSAAAAGKLRTATEVSAQARRMLNDPRTRSKTQYFLHHWLQMSHLENLDKDDKLFPDFDDTVISDLRTSLNIFLDDVVWSTSSDYRRLLLEDDLFVNQRLARFYGVSTNVNDDFIKVSLDPKQRSGVITHPYLLAAFAYQKTSSPIHRGVFLTRNIVGRSLKAPPVAVAFNEADFAPNLSMREKVAELTRPQACQGCHSVINPLGFSLEHYDAVGRFRTKEDGKTIDATAEYTTDDGKVVKLSGARDIAEFAIRSEHAQNAFVEQLFHQTVKQPVRAYGAGAQETLRRKFVESGYNIQSLLVEITTLAALHNPR
jgi:mono/diheme cytochrome c family protein